MYSSIRIRVFFSLTLLLFITSGYAQTITGKVINDQSEALEGAVITIRTTQQRILTAKDGSFSIPAASFPVKITIDYTGYEQKTLTLSNANAITIELQRDQKQLDDVIVTGYSVQSKRLIAGSITTIKASDIKDIPVPGVNQLLQGKAAGVTVTANSGAAGGGVTFRIRGNNSINASVDPLYIVDGVFISSSNLINTGLGNQQQSNPLADINPADIETIQVLKDANATAIYGSLGANGVVLITTKRGKLNSKARIQLNTYHGWSVATNKYVLATGPETALLTNESRINTALDNGLPASSATLIANPESQPTFYRTDDLFRTAKTSSYDISAQGGTDKSTYFLAFGYFKQESIVRPSNFDRFNLRFNYDNYISKKLKFGNSFTISRTFRNVSSNDNNPQGVINSALFPRSYLPIYNTDGTYARYGSFDNHIALIEHLNNKAVGWRTIGNVFLEYSILPELKFKSSWSLDNTSIYENNYANTFLAAGLANNGSASSQESKSLVLTNEQILTYIKSFGNDKQHNINALVGNTINSVLNENTSASGTGFASNDLQSVSVASIRSGSASRAVSKLVSFFGKASYTYLNKYTFDASVRADASSRFGENKRWGYFPSGGFTWRAGQESFIRDLNIFDELKFRASVGLSGNQNGIGSYAALGLWNSGSNYLDQPGVAPTQLANPDLTWETTRQTDIGVEFSVLKNRLTAIIDYYHKYTYDLLLNVPVPYRSGFASYLQNFGAVSNKGVELTLKFVNVDKKEFSWSSDFNISYNRNRIEKLASDIALGASGRNISILRQGFPINSFQLYRQLYVDSETGNAVYDDVNGDGLITAADRQIVGNALPRFTGGFTNNFQYKGFDLSIFFYFQEGNKIMNMNDFFLVHGNTQANIGFLPRQLQRWQQKGDITDIPRLTTFSGNPAANNSSANNYGGNVANLSTRYLEDGSFIRLRTVTLGYNFPAAWLRKLQLSNVRAYIQGTNLFTLTRYNGLDPEVNSQSSNQNTTGYDWATIPQPRTIQVGLNVSF